MRQYHDVRHISQYSSPSLAECRLIIHSISQNLLRKSIVAEGMQHNSLKRVTKIHIADLFTAVNKQTKVTRWHCNKYLHLYLKGILL